MAILLVRHAEAVDEAADLVDEHRYLTAHGRASCAALAAELRGAGLALDRIVTSPLVRAVQTAEQVASALGLDLVVEASARLAPGRPVRLAAEELEGAGGLVMAVGHEPSISALAGTLIGGRGFPSFRKAEACLIDGGRLVRWLGSDRR